MNPVLPLSILVPLLIAVTLAAAWMASVEGTQPPEVVLAVQ